MLPAPAAAAGRTKTVDACKASCKQAADPSSGCTFNVVSPAGKYHLPVDKFQNQSLQMCDNGPILSNGTQCSSCDGARDSGRAHPRAPSRGKCQRCVDGDRSLHFGLFRGLLLRCLGLIIIIIIIIIIHRSGSFANVAFR